MNFKIINKIFLIISVSVFTNLLKACQSTDIYDSTSQDSYSKAFSYSRKEYSLNQYLAFRDIPKILKKNKKIDSVADLGCGLGVSTRFLKKLGYKVVGLDINPDMITQAKFLSRDINFMLLDNYLLEKLNKNFDLVFSCFVVLEISSKELLKHYYNQVKTLLKPGGLFVLITGSNHAFNKHWLMMNVLKYPQNTRLNSGDIARVYLDDVHLEFVDYFWREEDHVELLNEVGFEIIEKHYPLGLVGEKISWKDELKYSPHVIMVAKLR